MALAGVTYADQRSFLIRRVDDQARAAAGVVQRFANGADFLGPIPDGRGIPDHLGDGPGEDGGGLPLGTYGQHRDASGRVTSAGFLGAGFLDSADLVAPNAAARPAAWRAADDLQPR